MFRISLTRQCTAVIVLSLIALLVIAYPQKASAINLKQNSVLSGNTITLGDVFYGLPHSADKVLGPAPRPGRDMVLNARTLMRIAMAMDLEWRPQSSTDYVVLSRAATVIERSAIETALKDALKDQGLNGLYNLVMPDEMAEIILPQGELANVSVSDMKLHKSQNRFEATLVAPSKDNPIYRSRVSGSIQNLVEIPVLKSAMRAGTIIGQHDIEMMPIPEKHLNTDFIVSANSLIGATPRRLITAGQSIKANEIESPKIVERGEYVTMIFNKGLLKLTARGKALQHGAKGDTIRIVNTSSNKTLEGVVTASKEVSVDTL